MRVLWGEGSDKIMSNWRVLKYAMATQATAAESGEIVRRLINAQIPVRRITKRTTKGTRCVVVSVSEDYYDKARDVVRDLITASPFTGRSE